jgi:hypothetical protein
MPGMLKSSLETYNYAAEFRNGVEAMLARCLQTVGIISTDCVEVDGVNGFDAFDNSYMET